MLDKMIKALDYVFTKNDTIYVLLFDLNLN
jgi:hypothetical protein